MTEFVREWLMGFSGVLRGKRGSLGGEFKKQFEEVL